MDPILDPLSLRYTVDMGVMRFGVGVPWGVGLGGVGWGVGVGGEVWGGGVRGGVGWGVNGVGVGLGVKCGWGVGG